MATDGPCSFRTEIQCSTIRKRDRSGSPPCGTIGTLPAFYAGGNTEKVQGVIALTPAREDRLESSWEKRERDARRYRHQRQFNFMQYLLTQEEMDALNGKVESQVRERVGRIAVAMEKVLTNYGIKLGTPHPYHDELLRELQKALRTP